MKLKWIKMYLDIAKRISQESHATRKKVGSVFVSEFGIMSIGINGLPAGGSNICEDYLEDGSIVTKPEVAHAEEQLFGKIMQQGLTTRNGSIFVTLQPCMNCSKIILASGVSNLYFIEKYRDDSGILWLEKNGFVKQPSIEDYHHYLKVC